MPIRRLVKKFLSSRTIMSLRFDMMRARTRMRNRKKHVVPSSTKLHVGCGDRIVAGWLNVDLRGSDFDVDLASGKLPWVNNSFDSVVSQHVIEHLDLDTELMPLLKELKRTMKPGGRIWLSCPDMEKVCRGYVQDRGASLLKDRQRRFPDFALGEAPVQQYINYLFQQDGEHKNLFDFELLKWVLENCGFKSVLKVNEKQLLGQFPEFPARDDDDQALYVSADA